MACSSREMSSAVDCGARVCVADGVKLGKLSGTRQLHVQMSTVGVKTGTRSDKPKSSNQSTPLLGVPSGLVNPLGGVRCPRLPREGSCVRVENPGPIGRRT